MTSVQRSSGAALTQEAIPVWAGYATCEVMDRIRLAATGKQVVEYQRCSAGYVSS